MAILCESRFSPTFFGSSLLIVSPQFLCDSPDQAAHYHFRVSSLVLFYCHQKRNANRLLVGKPEGRRPIGRPRRSLERLDGVDWSSSG
jgi:hypothetical protein